MSNGKININISGGTSNIGNISQGDDNTNVVQSQTINSETDEAFALFFEHLQSASANSQIQEQQISDLKAEVESLKESLEAGSTSDDSLAQIAKNLYEKYGWAADILKKLFTVLGVLA